MRKFCGKLSSFRVFYELLMIPLKYLAIYLTMEALVAVL